MSDRRLQIGFVNFIFPGLTTTFITREFEALSLQRDLEMISFALKRHPKSDLLEKSRKQLMSETHYVIPDHIWRLPFSCLHAIFFRFGKLTNLIRVFRKGLKNKHGRRRRDLWAQFVSCLYLSRYVHSLGLDGIHGHFEAGSTIGWVINRLYGIPYTFTIHANELYTDTFLLEEKIKHAKLVITENTYNIAHINLLTRYRFKDKLRVVYNGIDTNHPAFNKAQIKSDFQKPLKMLSVGSFTGFKGYPTVLNALSKMKKQNLSFKYRIIGDGENEEREMIKKLIVEYDLQNDVELLGAQNFDRVACEMIWCDVFIMASEIFRHGRRDGIPTVILEAMLLKRPVVSTYISDIPNVIEDKTNGYLFPEKNADKLFQILSEIYQKYESTQSITLKAYQKAMVNYTSKKTSEQLASFLRQAFN